MIAATMKLCCIIVFGIMENLVELRMRYIRGSLMMKYLGVALAKISARVKSSFIASREHLQIFID